MEKWKTKEEVMYGKGRVEQEEKELCEIVEKEKDFEGWNERRWMWNGGREVAVCGRVVEWRVKRRGECV